MRLYGLKDCPAMREIVVGLSRMLEPRKVFEEHLAKAKNPLEAPVHDRVFAPSCQSHLFGSAISQ